MVKRETVVAAPTPPARAPPHPRRRDFDPHPVAERPEAEEAAPPPPPAAALPHPEAAATPQAAAKARSPRVKPPSLPKSPVAPVPKAPSPKSRAPKRIPTEVSDAVEEARHSRFLDLSFTGEAGSRAYKLFIPSSYRVDTALPLVILLHGCGQSADDFALGTRMNEEAEAAGFIVAYPEQSSSANPNRCWNWFNPHDQQRDYGEPSLIAGITRTVIADWGVDAKRVYVAGLSAGGAEAVIMGTTYPELFAAVGVHSGLAYGAAHSMTSAFHAMQRGGLPASSHLSPKRKPTIVFHGDADPVVNVRNGDHIIADALASKGSTLIASEITGQSDNGYLYTLTRYCTKAGNSVLEHWLIHGAGHAWLGGNPAGSFADAKGPSATKEMLRFFLSHKLRPTPKKSAGKGEPATEDEP